MKYITAIFLCTILLWACTKKEDAPTPVPVNTNGTDRGLMLTHIADNIILPGYASFKIKLDSMHSKSEVFAASPDETSLNAFRQSWTDAYIEWQKVELFDFGPAAEHTLRFFFNIYPTSTSDIEANVSSGTANLELPSSYASQGFPALDYLINGTGISDPEIVARYTSAPDAAKRVTYLKQVVAKMNSMFSLVHSEWLNTYRGTFISKTSLDAGSSTSSMVNGYLMHYERYIRSGKFGIPSGAMMGSGGSTYPQNIEAYYKKDLSLTLAKTAHQAMIDFFNGKDIKTGSEGPSLKTYINALGAKDSKSGASLSTTINSQLTTVNSKLNLLQENLSQEVITNNQAMINVFTEMQNVIRLLKVDMTSAMSITISYVDNDGD